MVTSVPIPEKSGVSIVISLDAHLLSTLDLLLTPYRLRHSIFSPLSFVTINHEAFDVLLPPQSAPSTSSPSTDDRRQKITHVVPFSSTPSSLKRRPANRSKFRPPPDIGLKIKSKIFRKCICPVKFERGWRERQEGAPIDPTSCRRAAFEWYNASTTQAEKTWEDVRDKLNDVSRSYDNNNDDDKHSTNTSFSEDESNNADDDDEVTWESSRASSYEDFKWLTRSLQKCTQSSSHGNVAFG